MKKYTKPEMLAKNLPTGSYAAGCPSKEAKHSWMLIFIEDTCKKCDRAS